MQSALSFERRLKTYLHRLPKTCQSEAKEGFRNKTYSDRLAHKTSHQVIIRAIPQNCYQKLPQYLLRKKREES